MQATRTSLFLLLALLIGSALSREVTAQLRDPEPSGTAGPTRDTPAPARAPFEFPPLEGPVDPARYQLGPGDELELALFGRVTARVPLAVNAEGSIYIPNLGHVRVSGLTLIEARKRLSQELARKYRGVQGDIILLRPRRILVHVAGEVRTPGLVELQAPARVSEAVKRAGGFTERASRRNLSVERAGGAIEQADLESYAALGLPSENPQLDNGDVVRVPASLQVIEIQGEVARSGLLEFRRGDRLSRIVALAGGTRVAADSDTIEVWRFFSRTEARPLVLPLRAALESPGGPADPMMEPDDRIYVRNVAEWHRRATAQVVGEATHPGSYAISPQGELASELIARFGGFTQYADLNSATVVRPGLLPTRDTAYVATLQLNTGQVTGEDTEFLKVRALAQGTLSARFRKLVVEADTSADFQILDGDVVTIPARTKSVAVYGAVRRPGVLAFRQGASLEDYITAAGGYGKRADRGKVRVTQATTGQPLRASDVASVEEGDLVWVPERERKYLFRTIGGVTAFLAAVSTIYLVIAQSNQ